MSIAATATLSLFSPHIELEAADEGQPRRYRLYHREQDMTFVLGEAELTVAQLFDGVRTHRDIIEHLRQSHSITLSEAKLSGFDEKLQALGILHNPSAPPPSRPDPSAGITYGPLKQKLMIPLFRTAPQPLLDAVAARFPWVVTRFFVAGLAILMTAALATVAARWPDFTAAAKAAYGGWDWLAWHYPILIASVALHEAGHALACRAYKVRVTEIGLAIYLFFVTGWARPVQRDWSARSKGQRIVTILVGPFCSLAFASFGVGVWTVAADGSAASRLGVMMAVTSTLALLPTLLPIFNGDGYLALTEYFGTPGLRQKAWNHARNRLLGRPPLEPSLSPRRALLYYTVTFGTAAGWGLAWFGLISLLVR